MLDPMSGQLDGDAQTFVTGKANACHDILGIVRDEDQSRVLINGEIPAAPHLLVARLMGHKDAAGDLLL
jgi:hypothetical protein